jgi:hypothetical protein
MQLMTLEAVYFISQVVAAVALIGSLLFVGVQVRQNTQQAQQANRIAHAESLREMVQGPEYWHPLFAVPGFAEEFRYCLNRYDTADPAVKTRFHGFMFSLWLHLDSMHRMQQRGLFDDDLSFRYIGAWKAMVSTPGGGAWWNEVKLLNNPQFEAAMEEAFARMKDGGLEIIDAFDVFPFFREQPGEFNENTKDSSLARAIGKDPTGDIKQR